MTIKQHPIMYLKMALTYSVSTGISTVSIHT